jgi:beta-glucosidase
MQEDIMATFPDNFVWGAAMAAYQIEGAVGEDGRGPSIWDTFSHTPGKTLNGDTGDAACDHYHRWQDDIALMQSLGLHAYRFSIAWPRVLPQGAGQVNNAGLDFYDKLVDALLAADITPFVTLYHWDLPQALQDHGGWAHRDTATAFATYAEVVAKRLGDRVTHWITLNEPWVSAFLGYALGEHAPGFTEYGTALQAAHHLLLGHGLAVPVLRSVSPAAQIGITLNASPAIPATPSADDEAAAQRFDGFLNRWFLDPVFGRGYPDDMAGLYSILMPRINDGDLDTIAAPLDFLGINYYFPMMVRAVPLTTNLLRFALPTYEEAAATGVEMTAMGWPVVPTGLLDVLLRVEHDYHPPAIYITENGAAFDDEVIDGTVHDERRIAYLQSHLGAAHMAIEGGVPLQGYFVWSLLDNFEWAHGYSKRFGIVYVDYPTQRRIPKASAHWYRQVIAANAVE